MRKIYDVIVVGTGISGLSTAIFLKEKGLDVLVLTKEDEISGTNTNLAQGGIVAKGLSDNAEILKKIFLQLDTIIIVMKQWNNLQMKVHHWFTIS